MKVHGGPIARFFVFLKRYSFLVSICLRRKYILRVVRQNLGKRFYDVEIGISKQITEYSVICSLPRYRFPLHRYTICNQGYSLNGSDDGYFMDLNHIWWYPWPHCSYKDTLIVLLNFVLFVETVLFVFNFDNISESRWAINTVKYSLWYFINSGTLL